MNDNSIKPFLRWAGGKSKFSKTIISFFPPSAEIGTYYEPFLGAASIYLEYQPKKAKLSDLNEQLIDTFIAIKKNPSLVEKYLIEFVKSDSEDFYYKVRSDYNKLNRSIRQSARFIYLKFINGVSACLCLISIRF